MGGALRRRQQEQDSVELASMAKREAGREGQSATALLMLAERIDAVLPQTQCTQCGFDGCRPYAESVAGGHSPANLCTPGGSRAASRIAELINCETNGLEPENKHELVVALIDEQACVGCYKCIEACPVDAVVGAHGLMHTVMRDWCTGCGLCVEPCPADCIELVPFEGEHGTAQNAACAEDFSEASAAADLLRRRHGAKMERPGLREPEATSRIPAGELAAKAMRRARRARSK